jgi:flagellar biosynthetic protein FliR
MDIVQFSTQALTGYILILLRVSGLFAFAPVLSSTVIPAQMKVAGAMVVSLALTPVVSPVVPAELTLGFLVKSAAGETAVGLLIGYAANLIFVAVQLAGMQIDQQMGMGIGSVFNPLLESQDSLVGQFYFLFATLVYLGIGGHRLLFAALTASFGSVPAGVVPFGERTLMMLISLFGQVFVIAFALSAPMVLALFLTTVAMGFLARTVPQMNVLIIGFPVRIVVGLTMMAVTLPAVGQFLAATIGAILSGLPALVAAQGI